MKQKYLLQFNCQGCQHPVGFSIFEIDQNKIIQCLECEKKYAFSDENLKRQLKKFEALCRQLVDSEEILSETSVGVDVGERHIKIPYKLLLTRLSSTLDLRIGNQPLSISFRIEPLKDLKR